MASSSRTRALTISAAFVMNLLKILLYSGIGFYVLRDSLRIRNECSGVHTGYLHNYDCFTQEFWWCLIAMVSLAMLLETAVASIVYFMVKEKVNSKKISTKLTWTCGLLVVLSEIVSLCVVYRMFLETEIQTVALTLVLVVIVGTYYRIVQLRCLPQLI